MWNRITRLIGQYLGSVLNIIDFKGSAYLNMWSLSLLLISIWVCYATKSVPTSVAMIFSSIVLAYGAHKATENLSGKGKNDNDDSNSGSN
jgi:hypothetical protein